MDQFSLFQNIISIRNLTDKKQLLLEALTNTDFVSCFDEKPNITLKGKSILIVKKCKAGIITS